MSRLIDDGFNAHWVKKAVFEGIMEIPVIHKPAKIYIPKNLVPFSCRNRCTGYEEIVCFYEHDAKFYEFINHPDKYIGDLKKFAGVISPDASVYIDMPLCLQITDVYFNRALGHYLQQQGMYVIPNIRWGDERTYTTCELPEKIAFLGVEKESIVAVGSYGQIHGKEAKRHFKQGLAAMLEELEPKIVLVYGSLSDEIFNDFTGVTDFVQYDDWITRQKNR